MLEEPLVENIDTTDRQNELERRAFEDWYSDGSRWKRLVQRKGSRYKLAQTQQAWAAWKARCSVVPDVDIAELASAFTLLWASTNRSEWDSNAIEHFNKLQCYIERGFNGGFNK